MVYVEYVGMCAIRKIELIKFAGCHTSIINGANYLDEWLTEMRVQEPLSAPHALDRCV